MSRNSDRRRWVPPWMPPLLVCDAAIVGTGREIASNEIPETSMCVGRVRRPPPGGTPMDMTGEYRIAAPRQRVWQALNDPETLKHCIPGCEEIDKLSDVEWTAKVTAKVGPVKAKFGGKVTLSDLDPPNGYTITGEGTGGAAGFAKGGAEVKLREDGGGT